MSRGATARLFVAVDPPPEVCAQLTAWARAVASGPRLLPALRVLDAGSLHLTLCFLGSRPVEEIEALGAALAPCAAAVGELAVGAPLLLPPRHPRALAVAIGDPEGALVRLHRRLVLALAEASGREPERRRLRAHVTVARMRGGPRGGAGQAAALPATPPLRFTPRSLVLYRSWLHPSEASYEALAECELLPDSR